TITSLDPNDLAEGLFLHTFDEVLGDSEVYVRLKHTHPYVFKRVLDVLFRDLSFAFESISYVTKSFGYYSKHAHGLFFRSNGSWGSKCAHPGCKKSKFGWKFRADWEGSTRPSGRGEAKSRTGTCQGTNWFDMAKKPKYSYLDWLV